MSKAILAVDPGSSSGAMAWQLAEDDSPHAVNMPATPMDICKWVKLMTTGLTELDHGLQVYMEDVGSTRPGNSARSAHTFARHMGHLDMAFLACNAPVILVRPQKWQRRLFGDRLPRGPDNLKPRKLMIYAEMQRRFPQVEFTLRQADAMAILAYSLEIMKEEML